MKYILRPEVLKILVKKFLATVFVKLYSVHSFPSATLTHVRPGCRQSWFLALSGLLVAPALAKPIRPFPRLPQTPGKRLPIHWAVPERASASCGSDGNLIG